MARDETGTIQDAPLPAGPDTAVIRALLRETEVADAYTRIRAVFPAPLCVRCLGRPVSRAARTLDNVQKGRMVLDVLAPPHTETAAECPWCEGLFEETAHFVALLADATKDFEFDTILVATRVHPDVQARDKQAEEAAAPALAEHYEPMKTELNREVANLLLPRLGVEGRFDKADLVALLDPYFDTVDIHTNPVYLYGRYRKFDRTIPQTKWPCRTCQGRGCRKCDDTGKQYQTSVEELIAHAALRAFDARDESFHGSGREDIDALMLGTGRPFVIELKSPRFRRPRAPVTEESTDEARPGITVTGPATMEDRALGLAELQELINAHARPAAEIEGLRFSAKDEVVRIKEAALDKAYRAHVVADHPVPRQAIEEAIAQVTAAPIQQRTPERVAHRRADKVRERTVHGIQVAAWGAHPRAAHEVPDPEAPPPRTEGDATTHLSLDIHAESGTYIKELIHGDEGRTQPSFAGLTGIPMRVVALDVVGVGPDEDRRPT